MWHDRHFPKTLGPNVVTNFSSSLSATTISRVMRGGEGGFEEVGGM